MDAIGNRGGVSVESKMRKAIKGGRRAGHPEADALITEMSLIIALQDEMALG